MIPLPLRSSLRKTKESGPKESKIANTATRDKLAATPKSIQRFDPELIRYQRVITEEFCASSIDSRI